MSDSPPIDRARLYERILASTRDHLSLVDRQYVYLVVNDAYLQAHGVGREAIEGRDVPSLLGQETFERVVRPRLDRALAGEVVEYEDWFDFDGIGRRRMSVAYFPYSVADDAEPMGVLVRATDVTRERAMQEDLRDRDERLGLFLEAAGVGTWEWFIQENEVMWSDRVLELFGQTRDEFGGTYEAFLSMIHDDDRAWVERVVASAIEEPAAGNRNEAEYRIVRPDGTTRWQHARGAVMRGDDGRPRRMLGILSDVTERKSLEAQLSHSQKLDAIGRLAGGIAHDFNNLLTAIVGSAEIGARAKSSAQVNEAFTIITTASERAATLVNKLLTFAHLGANEPSVVDINARLRSLQRMLVRLLPENIDISFDLATEPLHVYIDPSQLEQVVVNLAVNARDAMPGGGHLRIATAREPASGGEPARVRVDVVDDGCGIPEEVRDRVLEPFFTTKPRGVGSGLGLATCHGVVERAGGAIEIESEVGVGTAVGVLLPEVSGAATETEERAEVAPGRGRGQRVALVEDDALVRETVRLMLEEEGYEVVAFGGASEALAALAAPGEPTVDVLLTDVVMPEMSGPALAERARAHHPELRVLLISGYAREAGDGVDGFRLLTKPFSSRELSGVLQEMLQTRGPGGEPAG